MCKGYWLVTSLVLGVGLLAIVLIVPQASSAQPADTVSAADFQTLPILDATGGGGGPIGSSFSISRTSGVDALRPAVAYNSQREEYLAVWWNDRPQYDDVYGRRLTKDGELLPWFAIVWGAPHEYKQPDVAYNSQDDEYMVIYAEDWEIGGARLPATGGTPSWRFGFTTDGYSSVVYYDQPVIAYNPTQNVYLLAARFVNENWYGAWGSKVDAVGVQSDGSGMSSGVFSIEGFSTATRPEYPDVAYNAARDEFLIVWQRNDGSDWDIYGQRVEYDVSDSKMQKVGGSFPIFSTGNQESGPAVAAIPGGSDGEYMVVCSSESGGAWKIVGQRVTGQGGLEGVEIDIATGPGTKENVDVAASASGDRYLVVWNRAHATIRERAVSAEGQLLGDEVEMGGPLGLADEPAVVGGPLSDFFVAFQDVPPSAGDHDIYGHLWGMRIYLPLLLRAF